MRDKTASISVVINYETKTFSIPFLFYLRLTEIRPPYLRTNNMLLVKILFDSFPNDPLTALEDISNKDRISQSDIVSCLVYDYLKENGVNLFGQKDIK